MIPQRRKKVIKPLGAYPKIYTHILIYWMDEAGIPRYTVFLRKNLQGNVVEKKEANWWLRSTQKWDFIFYYLFPHIFFSRINSWSGFAFKGQPINNVIFGIWFSLFADFGYSCLTCLFHETETCCSWPCISIEQIHDTGIYPWPRHGFNSTVPFNAAHYSMKLTCQFVCDIVFGCKCLWYC